jgi:hypothetical protein
MPQLQTLCFGTALSHQKIFDRTGNSQRDDHVEYRGAPSRTVWYVLI